MKINSFTLYREYYDLITLLSDKEQANVLLAIAKYMFDNEEIILTERENKVFVNLKRPLEKSKNKSQNANKNKSNQNQNEIKLNSNEDTHQIVNVNVYDNVNVNNIYSFIESNFNRTLSPTEIKKIEKWLSLFNEDIIEYAIEIAVLNNVKTFQYTEGILKNWKSCNLNTLQEIKEAESKGKKTNNSIIAERLSQDVPEDTASEEEIKKLEERMKR